jgi:hypothetical protein
MRRLLTAQDEELRRNWIPIVRFIRSQIEHRVPFERLKQLAADLPEDTEHERAPVRGEAEIDELVVTKNQRRAGLILFFVNRCVYDSATGTHPQCS